MLQKYGLMCLLMILLAVCLKIVVNIRYQQCKELGGVLKLNTSELQCVEKLSQEEKPDEL